MPLETGKQAIAERDNRDLGRVRVGRYFGRYDCDCRFEGEEKREGRDGCLPSEGGRLVRIDLRGRPERSEGG